MAEQNLVQIILKMRDEMSTQMQGIARQMQSLQKETTSLSRTFGGPLTTAIKGAVAAMAAYASLDTLRGLVNVRIETDRLQNALKSATGSTDNANRTMGFLHETAQRLGLDFVSSSQAFAGLAAAARDTSLGLTGAQEIFTAVAEAATVMGLSAQQTEGVLLALQQMISKGTVAAEELRGQLGERLPGAFQIAAKAIGVTTAQLGKLLEQGKISAEDFLPKFARELRQSLGSDVPAAAQSATAQINRLSNAWRELRDEFNRSGFINLVTQGITGLTWTLGVLERGILGLRHKFDIGLDPTQKIVRELTQIRENMAATAANIDRFSREAESPGKHLRLQAMAEQMRELNARAVELQQRLEKILHPPVEAQKPPSPIIDVEAQKKADQLIKGFTQSLYEQGTGLLAQRIALKESEEAALQYSLMVKRATVESELLALGMTIAPKVRQDWDEQIAKVVEFARLLQFAQEKQKLLDEAIQEAIKSAEAWEAASVDAGQSILRISQEINDVFLTDRQREEAEITRWGDNLRMELLKIRDEIPALATSIDALLAKIPDATKKKFVEANELVKTFDRLIEGTFQGVLDAFTGAIEQGKSLGEVFRNLGQSLLLGLSRSLVQEAFKPLEDALKRLIRRLVLEMSAEQAGGQAGGQAGRGIWGIIATLLGLFGGGGGMAGGLAPTHSTGAGGQMIIPFAASGAIFPGGFTPLSGFQMSRLPVRAFAGGGIASHPMFGLIGEGRQHEAVVPLPDNRAIPVRFQNGRGDTPVQVSVEIRGSILPERPGMTKDEVVRVVVQDIAADGRIRASMNDFVRR